jgi:hypothetical protein
MANLTPELLKSALEITGSIETDGNPWAGVSNDFDGMGISCGILQWNIGSKSLQPLVKACGKTAVQKYMPAQGEELWNACHATVAEGLAVVRSWQPNKKLKQDIRKQLEALFGSDEMIKQQMAACEENGESAMKLASRWANDLRGGEPTLKEFCLFFDLVTQNGGMKHVWLDDVRTFIANTGRSKVDDAVSNWLETRPPTTAHFSDGKKNAALWRNNVADADVELFALAYLRCLKSGEAWRVVALNRKGTIALTRGWVNGSKVDLPQLRDGAPINNGENPVTSPEKFLVNNEALNFRSAPDPSDNTNIKTTLTMNQEVIKLEESNVPNWWKVRVTIDGVAQDGYVNRKFLVPGGQ